MAGNLGTLTLDLIARIGGFTQPLDQAQRHAQQRARAINAALSSIGAGVSVAGIVAFAKSGIDALDNLNDLSLKTGVAVETLSGFSLAAKQSGTDLESLGGALNKLSINIAKNREEFAALGISAKNPADAFLQFADVFNSLSNEQDKAAFGAKALGKSYADLAPLLSLGSEELHRVVEEGQAASGATAALAKEADAFNDTLEVFKARLSGVAIILGGSFASAINNLVDNISAATSQGNVLIGVINGIGNALAHKQILGGVAGELQTVNESIDHTQKKINALQNNNAITGLIDDIVGNDITVEKNKLDALFKKQEQLANSLKAQTSIIPKQPGATPEGVKKLIGVGGDQEKKIKAASAARTQSMSDEQRAAEQLQHSYDSMLDSLTKELALHNDNSEEAKLHYEIVAGSLKGISPLQSQNLENLAKENDALALRDVQIQRAADNFRDFYELQKENSKIIQGGNIQDTFGDQISAVRDLLDKGIINEDAAKEEFDRLGQAFNDDFIAPAKEGTDQLSVFAEQAARNMQDAFADFLFDPFDQSLDSLADNFATTLRRMAANYLSSQLFDLLKSSVSGAGTGIGGSIFTSLFSGIAGLFGGGSQAASDAAFLASAKGNVFAGGNVIPFATGGVVNAPTFFPLSSGKTGLMGEAGPEAIIPLARGADGKLGIKGGFGGGQNVNITVNVQGGSAPDVRRSAAQGAREAMGFLSGAQRYG
jgi:phage-related minor tail protein